MKSKKLNEAFNYVDDTYLEIAEREKKKKRPVWIQWTALAACLCILAAAFLPVWLKSCPAGDAEANKLPFGALSVGRVLAKASYPEMAPYPNEADYIDKNGEFDDEAFDEAYTPWREDRKAMHSQPVGYADGMEDFLDRSIPQFLSGGEGENRLYSPLNVYMALAMLAEVTGGETRTQILDLLGSDSIEALRTQAGHVWRANYYNDGGTASILANSLWLSDGLQYNTETLERLAEDYFASSFSGTMGSEEYNKMLQDWLKEQTGGLLEDDVSGEKMDPLTVLTLASTVYFRCRWQTEFWEENTVSDTFYRTDGTQVTCDFLHQSGSDHYYWADHFGAVCKPLEDGFQMWFLLPDEGITPEQLVQESQTMEFLRANGDWENSKYLIVNLSVPKFDVSSQMSLSDGLQALGVTDVFQPGTADFTPLTVDAEDIALTSTSHAVRVAIDEEGVTAAAYTVMMADGASAPPEEKIDFTLDRPFLFAITGQDGLPLFVGIVNNPG